MREDSCFHGMILAVWCSEGVVLLWPSEWVKEWATLWNYGGFVHVPKSRESRWQKNSLAWLGTSPSPTVCFLPFPRLPRARSRFPTATRHWRDIHAYAQLMKTFLCCKKQWSSQRWLSPFLLPTLFHPHCRWTEVKAKPCSLRASLLQCCVRACMGLWNGKVVSPELAPLKLPTALQNYLSFLCCCCMERWGWEDVVNDSNEIWAKVWLGLVSLPCVISYFQTAHHREKEKNREEEKSLGGGLVSVCAQRGMQI